MHQVNALKEEIERREMFKSRMEATEKMDPDLNEHIVLIPEI